jgi:AcrR family transcriptional regulator
MPTGERVYRGMSAAERRADRRDRLREALLDVVGEGGYAAATIPAICSRAGVTARHLYAEHGGREDLLVAVYREVAAEHLDAVLAAQRAEPGALEARVRAGVAAAVHGWLDDERRARLAFVEVVGVSPRVEQERLAVLDAYARSIAAEADALVAAGLLAARDRTVAARGVVGLLTHVLSDWLARREPGDVDALVDELARLVLAVLR